VPIAVTEDHEALRLAAQRWAQTHCPAEVARAVAESDGAAGLPGVWEKMAAQGWLGLHVPERAGGQGFTLAEVAVVLEELGHALLPGPLLPTLVVSAVLARRPDDEAGRALLPGLVDGSVTAAVALGSAPAPARTEQGALRVGGAVRPVLGQPDARLVLVPLAADGGPVRWLLLDRARSGSPPARPLAALDATRALWSLEFSGEGVVVDHADQVWVSDDEVRGLAQVLTAAECAGLARWCLQTASDYSKVRVQFGRPIGQFQAVKHALADMLVAVEQAAAVAWDGAAAWSEDGTGQRQDAAHERDLSARVAGTVALEAAAHCAK